MRNPSSGRSFKYVIKSLPTVSLMGREIRSTDMWLVSLSSVTLK